MPELGVKENELVDVPGEEEFGSHVGGFLVGVLDQGRIVRIAAFRCAGQLHLSGKNEFLPGAIHAEVRALSVDTLGFFDFGALEGPVRVVCKKGIGPL